MRYQDELDFKTMGVKVPLEPAEKKVYDVLRKVLGKGAIPMGTLVIVPLLAELFRGQLTKMPPTNMSDADPPPPKPKEPPKPAT